MSKLLLLPPSVVANSALVNKLSVQEVHPFNSDFVIPLSCFFVCSAGLSFQINAACSARQSSADISCCNDAFRIVRQLCVSALESGDIDSWKAALLQESDLDASHVEAIAQSIQVTRLRIVLLLS